MNDPLTTPTGPALPVGTSALLLRVWFDPGAHAELRARLLSVVDGRAPTTWSVADGEVALTAEVGRWVAERRAEACPGEVLP